MAFGRTNYERTQFKRKNYWKLEEGESIYRVLPPYGSLQETNRFSYFWRIHFGFAGTDGKMKPFACIQSKDGNGMTTQRCPVCELRTQLQIKERELTEKGEGELALKPIRDRIRAIDPDAKHYMNVMTMDGQLGSLKIPNKSMTALKNRIEKLREDGKDPVNPEGGVFFVFTRHGTGNQTDHQVDVYKEHVTVNGEKLERTKAAPLTEEIIRRCDGQNSEIFDLPMMYKRLTEEELDMLVKGDATIVDRLFARPERNGAAKAPAPQAQQPAAPTPPAVQATAMSTPTVEVPANLPAPPPVAAAPAPEAPKAAAPVQASKPVDVASMSNEEFERMFQDSIRK